MKLRFWKREHAERLHPLQMTYEEQRRLVEIEKEVNAWNARAERIISMRKRGIPLDEAKQRVDGERQET